MRYARTPLAATRTNCSSHASAFTWKAGKIGRLLDNPAYAALMPLDGGLVAGNWEPLVEPGLWHGIAERRKRTREKWSRPRAAKRLLAGLIYCGDCGRKAYYTARGGGLPGRYRCGRSDATRICGAGGVGATRAEAHVTRAFLERARYYLMRGAAGSSWPRGSGSYPTQEEKRMLLAAAIDRVVILPVEPGKERPDSAGRAMRIYWKEELTAVQAPPVNKHTKGTGRAQVLARAQLREVEERRIARAERTRAYYREWSEWRARLRGEAR